MITYDPAHAEDVPRPAAPSVYRRPGRGILTSRPGAGNAGAPGMEAAPAGEGDGGEAVEGRAVEGEDGADIRGRMKGGT